MWDFGSAKFCFLLRWCEVRLCHPLFKGIKSVYRLLVRRLTVLFCDGMETRHVIHYQEVTR